VRTAAAIPQDLESVRSDGRFRTGSFRSAKHFRLSGGRANSSTSLRDAHVPYRKGELSPAAVDRGWPRVIHNFCRPLSLCPRGHSVNDGREWYRVYCFAGAGDAESFMARFGGERFDPAKRGRGHNWARWKR
jgi:hypothetical protein